MSFENYKNRRADLFKASQEQAQQATAKTTYEKDPDDWYPGEDAAGNGIAIVRFMPPREDSELKWARWYNHSFENTITGRWYIENCLSTFGWPKDGFVADPCQTYYSKLYKSSEDINHPNRKWGDKVKRNINFRSVVYVIADSSNKDNNNKLKKYKFGMGVFNELVKAMNPVVVENIPLSEQQVALDPFDLIS